MLNDIVPVPAEKNNSNLGIVSPDVQELFEATRQLKENGKSLYQSTISGWAPFERMAKGGRSVVKNLLKHANVEGAEELASYIMNYAADVSANDENAHFSLMEAIERYAGGAVSGGTMGGAAAAIGNYAPSYSNLGTAPKVGNPATAHLNMGRELAGKRYNNVLPMAGRYSSDIDNVNVNIGGMSAMEYLDYMNGQNTLPKVETNINNAVAMPRYTEQYTGVDNYNDKNYNINRGDNNGKNTAGGYDIPSVAGKKFGNDGTAGQRSIGQGVAGRYGYNTVGKAGRHEQSGNTPKREVLLVNENTRQKMNDKGIADLKLRDSSNDNALFSRSLDEGKTENPYGAWVDSHSAEELDKKGTKTYLSSDNTAGVAVEADGNITGVFKNSNNKSKNAVQDLLITAIENSGNKLDCYGQGLVNKYTKLGFIPVARMDFNPDYADDENLLLEKPDVYFFVHNGESAVTAVENIEKYKPFTKTELDALPTFTDYDEALKYRDSLIPQIQQKNKSGTVNADNTPVFEKSNSNLGIVNPDMAKRITSLSNELGRKISFADETSMPELAGKNGMYRNGEIYINKNSKRPVYEVFKHELTHSIETSPKYNGLMDEVTGYMDSMIKSKYGQEMSMDVVIQGIMQDYAKQGITLSAEDARHEAVADFVGEYLFKNETELKKLAKQRPAVVQKILDIIGDVLAKLKGQDTTAVVRMQKKFRDALKEASTENTKTQYTINRDGKVPYVKESRDINLGDNPIAWETRAREYIKNEI